MISVTKYIEEGRVVKAGNYARKKLTRPFKGRKNLIWRESDRTYVDKQGTPTPRKSLFSKLMSRRRLKKNPGYTYKQSTGTYLDKQGNEFRTPPK